jgi:hypothetical protein
MVDHDVGRPTGTCVFRWSSGKLEGRKILVTVVAVSEDRNNSERLFMLLHHLNGSYQKHVCLDGEEFLD